MNRFTCIDCFQRPLLVSSLVLVFVVLFHLPRLLACGLLLSLRRVAKQAFVVASRRNYQLAALESGLTTSEFS